MASAAGGRRLAGALAAAGGVPALADTHARVLAVAESGTQQQLGRALESDPALALAVVRAANAGGDAGGVGISGSVARLGAIETRRVAGGVGTYELFESSPGWGDLPSRFRRHGLATRFAAEQICEVLEDCSRETLVLAALLHDVGRLVLARLYESYPSSLLGADLTPAARVDRERRSLGIDHALIGGVLTRRWGLPADVSRAIERHHSDDAVGGAAALRLADLIANHREGAAVSRDEVGSAASACGMEAARLRSLLAADHYRRVEPAVPTQPSPLSRREASALRGLAEGKVYKQIAADLGLSPSTIRTHLHNVYRKIGVADRAQAVLLARERGWL
ncbi:MAG: HDOD domain-containing protein [Solirubrobacterales bacterium]